jgi:hypothetical protein
MKESTVKIAIGLLMSLILTAFIISRFVCKENYVYDRDEEDKRQRLMIQNAIDEGKIQGINALDSSLAPVINARERSINRMIKKLEEAIPPSPPRYTMDEADSAYKEFLQFANDNK